MITYRTRAMALAIALVSAMATAGAAPQRGEFGTLSIQVRPPDAEIYIDGERWTGPESSGPLVVQLAAGTHRVELRAPGREPFVREVTIRAGETTPLNVSLGRAEEPTAPSRRPPETPAPAPGISRVQASPDDDGFMFAPDVRITPVNHEMSTLLGMYGGYVFDGRLLVGAGGYWQANSTNGMRLAYGGPVLEWRALRNRPVGINLHGLIGAGVRYADYWGWNDWDDWDDWHARYLPPPGYHGMPYGWHDDVFFVAEPEVQLVVRFGSSLRLQSGIGYRATSANGLSGASGSISLQFGR